MPPKLNHLVLSALGRDRPGIVNGLAKTIHDYGANITDSRMTVLGGEFAAMLLVEGPWNTLAKVEGAVGQLERELGLTIVIKRTEPRSLESKNLPYSVEVIAMDHPGIVNHLAGFFADRQINIEDMATQSYPAPHTGAPMFSVQITIGVPNAMSIAVLREEFMDYCDGLNLDAVLGPIK